MQHENVLSVVAYRPPMPVSCHTGWVSGNKSSFSRGDHAIQPLLEAPADDSGLFRDSPCNSLQLAVQLLREATCRYKSAPVGIQLPDFGGRPRLQPSHPRFHIAQILGEHFFICLRGSSSLSSRAEHVHLTSSERLVTSECIELGATWA